MNTKLIRVNGYTRLVNQPPINSVVYTAAQRALRKALAEMILQ